MLQVAEVVPLKQGLKLDKKEGKVREAGVAEVVPLKQGLKLSKIPTTGNTCESCRGSSIKTRIETYKLKQYPLEVGQCCRGSSIKTRIETLENPMSKAMVQLVAEVVPLKQGLKQIGTAGRESTEEELQR